MLAKIRARLCILLLAVSSAPAPTLGQTSDETLERAHAVVQQLTAGAKYKDAEALALQLVAAYRQRDGEGSERHARALHTLADVYRLAGEPIKAEPIQRRACDVALRIYGPAHGVYGICINNLSVILEALGQSDAAEQLQRRALQTRERANGPNHPETAQSLNNLATILQRQGRQREAEALHRRALGIRERLPIGPDLAQSQANLAATLDALGRHVEAEALYQRALVVAEQAVGRSHPYTASVLNNLGVFYRERGRPGDAEPVLRRVLGIYSAISAAHPNAALASVNLAMCLFDLGKYAEAEPMLRDALGVMQRQGLDPGSTIVLTTLLNYADLLRRLGRIEEAVNFAQMAQTVLMRTPASDPALRAQALIVLALSRDAQGRTRDALNLHGEALVIRRKLLPPDHPVIVTTLGNMGLLNGKLGDWAAAERYLRMATSIATSRIQATVQRSTSELRGEEITLAKDWFAQHARALHRSAANTPSALDEAFLLAQRAEHSKAAAAVAQVSARLASGTSALATTVRQVQDLRNRRSALEQNLLQALSVTQDAEGGQRSALLRRERDDIDTKLLRLQADLSAAHPSYSTLTEPSPVTIQQVQQALQPNEVVVLFLLPATAPGLADEGLVFVVGKAHATWRRLPVGTQQLQKDVAALRCGLDTSAWQAVASGGCRTLLGLPAEMADPAAADLPFDLARAYALYANLFGQIDDLIRHKHLLIVASGPLAALPFQALVTAAPESYQTYADATWFGMRQPFSVLPAVSSMRSLRQHAKASAASEPFIGFGNPLLTGQNGTDRQAWSRQSCPAPRIARAVQRSAAVRPAKRAGLVRGGLARVEEVRRQDPLVETADEVCAVARLQGVVDPDRAVHLGEKATEARLKQMSDAGDLARARILHFATHGLVAGETASLAGDLAEPALVLTPPTAATDRDDGLLTASEVAGLRIDADWVVLSACNTAAGDKVEGDALAGLARAFFYAGARALLVSHWYVDSQATVTLITKAFEALRLNSGIGRAEAMRRSMAALIAGGGRSSHPAVWAPFVVVGEGGAGR